MPLGGRRRAALAASAILAGSAAVIVAARRFGRHGRDFDHIRPGAPEPRWPYDRSWSPGPLRYGVGVHRNVAVRMSDGVVLRADIHYPTEHGRPATGPFPVLLSMTPYGKKAPPPAAQLGGGPSPYLVRRGYIEVMVDVRGTGTSGGSFEMLGADQVRDGVELIGWAARLPESNGRVGMFGISYLAINQLLTAAAVEPGSPLKAVFPVMAAHDFYRDAATMGGIPHLRLIRGYRRLYALLNVVNPVLEYATPGRHPRPRAGGSAEVRRRGRDQRRYFGPLIADAVRNGEAAYDGPFWEAMNPAPVLDRIVSRGIAVLLVGGWHDAFQRGAPLNYAGLHNAHAGRAVDAPMQPGQPMSDRVRLVMGPWYHVSDFGGRSLLELQLRWFDQWLKDGPAAVDGPELAFQPIGDSRWFGAEEYPLTAAEPARLHLADGGRLSPVADPSETISTLSYRRFGPSSGRSFEQWSLGLTGFLAGLTGRRLGYDTDNRRVHRTGLTYTGDPVPAPTLLAGPVSLCLQAASTTTETIWVVHIDDVAPDGRSTPITQGALLGSHRVLDPDRTWRLADGSVLRPYHYSTREQARAVTPGESTRYDIEVFPTAALLRRGHRLRLTLTTFDFPQLVPDESAQAALAGGSNAIRQGGQDGSYLLVSFADPDSLTQIG